MSNEETNEISGWTYLFWLILGIIVFILVFFLFAWIAKLCFNASIVPMTGGKVRPITVSVALFLIILIVIVGWAFFMIPMTTYSIYDAYKLLA